MQLAPTGTLVVIDGESSPYQWSSRLHAGDLKRKMDGGRITFPYAAAGAPIELRLDARINAPLVRNVALAPGETKVVTFRGAPRPAVIKGTVSVPPPRPAKLSIVAVFVDREPGESAAEAAIEADGSFEVRLLTRRAALARDVGFIVKPDDVSAPRHSQYAGLRKRLTEPGEDGKFAIGTIAPALIEPWLAGVLTDVHGRPMPNTELSLDARHGCGSYCTGGGTWGADPPSVDDPTRPRLEAWPRIVRTDAEGTFSVTGFHYAGAFEFSFPGSTTGGRRILPEEITVPALDLHLVAENDTPVEVEIDGNAACVPNRRIWLDFDARRVPDPEPARPLVVAAAALIEPPDPEHPEFPEPRCWSCRLQLAPGCWFVTMKVHDDPAVVAEGEIVVSPLPVAASGSDPDTATTEPSRPVYRLQMVRPVPPEAPRLPHQAKVTVVGEDGTPCPEFKVWMRASPKAEWEFCREELGLAVAEFAEDFVEIEATAPGCAPASANVCAGNLTMRLRSLARAQLQVRVAPFPMGVQEGAEWGVHVDFVRPLNATPAESIWTKDPPYCFPEVVVGGSRVEFPLGVPGIYEVRLSGDGLTYATREIEVRSGVALTLDLAVDPASEGMRALTTGIGW
jgi:hypothetical protein